MTPDENKALMQRFYEEVVNQKKLQLIDDLVSADFVEHQTAPDLSPDREGVKQFFLRVTHAFPDLQMKVDDVIAEGDRVATRYTMTGTHQGEFMGVPPTGMAISVSGIDIVRFADGRVAEHWGITDQMTLMQQLGVMPEA
jgi:steroid delta-isomerase-like uncharacterized protein